MLRVDEPEVIERFNGALGLVERIAGQLIRTFGGVVEHEELVSAGREGLLHAARRFEPTRGLPFEAYASFRIRGAMIDSMRSMGTLPRRAHQRSRALNAAQLTSEGSAVGLLASDPPEETSSTADAALDAHLAELATAAATAIVVESVLPHDSDGARDDNPEAALERAQILAAVRACMTELYDDEALIIRRYYFEGDYLEAIARDMNITKSWASRIHARAIAKLTRYLHRAL